jgi:hypothetical protein
MFADAPAPNPSSVQAGIVIGYRRILVPQLVIGAFVMLAEWCSPSMSSACCPRQAPLERLLIRDRADVHVIAVGKIDFLESQDDYIAVRTGGRTFLKDSRVAILSDGTKLPISRTGYVRLRQLL